VRKMLVLLLILISCVSLVRGVDILRFSGTISDSEDEIGFDFESCGNDYCNDWEDFSNCPEDCEEVIETFFNISIIDYNVSSILSDNTFDNGGWWDFNLSYYSTSPYFEFRMLDDFKGNGHTLSVDGNMIMEYKNASGSSKVYDVKTYYLEPVSSYMDLMYDENEDMIGIQNVFRVRIKLPQDTYKVYYSGNWEGGLFAN